MNESLTLEAVALGRAQVRLQPLLAPCGVGEGDVRQLTSEFHWFVPAWRLASAAKTTPLARLMGARRSIVGVRIRQKVKRPVVVAVGLALLRLQFLEAHDHVQESVYLAVDAKHHVD